MKLQDSVCRGAGWCWLTDSGADGAEEHGFGGIALVWRRLYLDSEVGIGIRLARGILPFLTVSCFVSQLLRALENKIKQNGTFIF